MGYQSRTHILIKQDPLHHFQQQNLKPHYNSASNKMSTNCTRIKIARYAHKQTQDKYNASIKPSENDRTYKLGRRSQNARNTV